LGKKQVKKTIFWVSRQNRWRYQSLECVIGTTANNTTSIKTSKNLRSFFANFLSNFIQLFSNFLDFNCHNIFFLSFLCKIWWNVVARRSEDILQVSDFTCVRNRKYELLFAKYDRNTPKKSKISSLNNKFFSKNLCNFL